MFDEQDLLNTAPCGFLIFSDEGIILHVNETLAEMLLLDRDALIGKKLESILSIANRIFYQTHLFPLLKLHNKADEIFLTLLNAAREDVHVMLNAKRKLFNDKATNHCILIAVHQRQKYENELLLARRAAEEALKRNDMLLQAQDKLEQNRQELDRQVSRLTQLNRELQQFSKVISHDLQEPIRKIGIFADLAIKEASGPGELRLVDSLERIRRSCHRMSKMVSSLEEFLSLDSTGKFLEKVALNPILLKAKDRALTTTGFEGELKLTVQELPVINACRSQMELLFFNLIENAIKFRKPGDAVRIDVHSTILQENSYKSLPDSYRYHDVVKIVFTDTGKGFHLPDSTHLFQLFQKMQTHETGIGLGLALCKKIVDNHFGEITVTSKSGTATSFTILLPLLS